MNSFAIFRLPYTDICTMIEGESVIVSSLSALNDEQGFLLAPFSPSDQEPILLIRKSRLTQWPQQSHWPNWPQEPHLPQQPQWLQPSLPPSQSSYSTDFTSFHNAIVEGQFQKLVLARCATIAHDEGIRPMKLFEKACQLYPRMFVALVSTPQSGTWLTASPEILLESLPLTEEAATVSRWRTIALAGTMKLRSERNDDEGQRLRWSAKNIQEQRYVASYLADTLRRFSDDVCEEGPRTVRAGHLVHLRSDFTFTLYNNKCTRVGELLDALHPTPAVCGLPKHEAQRFILSHEHSPRHYYSGFMGPFNVNDNDNENGNGNENGNENGNGNENEKAATHLYVSLRCMHIADKAYHLYAGGGLLRESNEQQEWQETETKMDTMRHLLSIDT